MTIEANAELALIQDRMPVMIEKDDWSVWLGEAQGDPQRLMRPLPFDRFRVWPVSRAVNSVKHDGPELLELSDSAADGSPLL